MIAGLGVLAALAGVVFQYLANRKATRLYPPPGRLVDVGGRLLHARVLGSGAPTVVFESGISASSINWTALQDRIAAVTTTIAYDRAGLGWSSSASGALDANLLLEDLSGLLRQLHAPAPFILVGHSYGALLTRLYAEQHPEQVAGMVLVDPVLACDWANPNPRLKRMLQVACLMSSWGGFLARLGVVRMATAPLMRGSTVMPKLIGKASAGPAAEVIDRLAGEVRKLPPESWPVIRAHWSRPSNFRALVMHLRALPSSFAGLRNSQTNIPLVVISAADLSPDGLVEHRSIAARSTRGEHLVAARGGHWVQLDDAELVADAILRVIEAVRQ